MTLVTLLALVLSSPGADDPPPGVPAAQEAAPLVPQWSGALTLGFSWTDGNTQSETLNGNFNATRRGETDRWTLDAFSNFGSTTTKDVATGSESSDITTNNHGAGAKYDYFATKKLYYFGNLSGKVDHVADLGLRAIAGAGVGYQWKESDTLKWGTEAGLSYVDEDFDDNDFDASFVAARLASNLTYQISKSSAFEQVAEVLPSLENSEDVIAKIDNRLKLNITGKWIAQIQYVLDFDGSVPSGADPGFDGKEETDHRVVVSVGWSFGP